MLLTIALVLMAGLAVYALNAPKRPKSHAGPVVVSNVPLLAAAARPPTPPPQLTTPTPATPTPPPPTPAATISPSPVLTNATGPRIQFAAPTHDFGRVNAGDVAKYAFVFTNVGVRTLEITNVLPSCGCTTAGDWSRKVEPGQTGTIPIQFNSVNFSGQVGKSVSVYCNDPGQPLVTLQVKATIFRPIELTPQYAILNLTTESPTNSTTVRIVNNLEQPLSLSAPQIGNPAFAAELKTNQPGRDFELIVRTVSLLPVGRVNEVISLKTSSTNMPIINITAIANMQPVVVAVPSQITLPAGPLSQPRSSAVTIRNNGTNALALSEATLDAPGVTVELKELQPGRAFSVALTFPAGFEIAPSNKLELSLKSNHPQFPFLKVPVRQSPRPVTTAAPGRIVAPVPAPVGAQPK